MKSTTVYSLIIVGGALGLTSTLSAEPDNFGTPVRVPTTHSGPAFSTPDNASAGTASAGRSQPASSSTFDNLSSSGVSSSNGSGSSAGPTSSRNNTVSEGSSARSGNANDLAIEIAHEKVIDTGEKAVKADTTTQAGPVDKTFTSGLLDTVSDISKVSAQGERGAVAQDEDSQFKQKPAASEDKDDSHKKN